MPVAQDIIIGITLDGEQVQIERGAVLSLHAETRDWRRVQVKFADLVLSISTAAWQNCMVEDHADNRKSRRRNCLFGDWNG